MTDHKLSDETIEYFCDELLFVSVVTRKSNFSAQIDNNIKNYRALIKANIPLKHFTMDQWFELMMPLVNQGFNEKAAIMELAPPFTLDQFPNADGNMVCSLNWSAQFTIAQIVKRMAAAIQKNCFSEGISNYEALEMALACYHIAPEEFLVDCGEEY